MRPATKGERLNFSEEAYNLVTDIADIVREQCVALVRAEVQEVIQDLLSLERKELTSNAATLRGQCGTVRGHGRAPRSDNAIFNSY